MLDVLSAEYRRHGRANLAAAILPEWQYRVFIAIIFHLWQVPVFLGREIEGLRSALEVIA
jgi:hypothetical protein